MQSFSTQLTTSQASYLQSLLPQGYSLQTVISDHKRNRPVKKLDQSFTADYTINSKRVIHKQANHSSSHISERHQVSELTPKSNKKVSVVAEQSPDGLGISNNSGSRENLFKLLQKLKNCRYSWPFRLPVDPVAQGVPEYKDIIKVPMDLSTIEQNLKENSQYQGQKFHADVRKIIQNSYTFNTKESKFYAITQKFEAFYLKLCEDSVNIAQSLNKKEESYGHSDKISSTPRRNKKLEKIDQAEQPTKTELTMADKLTSKERQNLFHQIYELPQCDIVKLIKIVDESNLPKDWKEFELDFKDIDDEKFKKILKLVNDNTKAHL